MFKFIDDFRLGLFTDSVTGAISFKGEFVVE